MSLSTSGSCSMMSPWVEWYSWFFLAYFIRTIGKSPRHLHDLILNQWPPYRIVHIFSSNLDFLACIYEKKKHQFMTVTRKCVCLWWQWNSHLKYNGLFFYLLVLMILFIDIMVSGFKHFLFSIFKDIDHKLVAYLDYQTIYLLINKSSSSPFPY